MDVLPHSQFSLQGNLGRLDSVEDCSWAGIMLLLIFTIDEDVIHEAHNTG